MSKLKRKHEAITSSTTNNKTTRISPPELLFGTYKLPKDSCALAIGNAFAFTSSTFRGIDCAPIYNNEKQVGAALSAANVSRSSIWIQTKLWRSVRIKKVHTAIKKSLKDLKVKYVDCVLMHWPGPGRRLAFAPVTQTNIVDSVVVKKKNKNPEKVVCVPEDWTAETRLQCYAQMCSAITLGYTRSVGVCNFSLRQLHELVEFCKTQQLPLPSVVQNEFHPYLHVHAAPLIAFCHENNISYQAHSSLGGGGGGSANKKVDEYSLLQNTTIMRIAKSQNISPATLLFRWAMTKGVTSIIAKSTNIARIEENKHIFDTVFCGDGGEEIDALDLGHEGTTCFTWVREADPDAY